MGRAKVNYMSFCLKIEPLGFIQSRMQSLPLFLKLQYTKR